MTKHKKVHGHVPGPHQPTQNVCFACGPDNPDGLHLKFVLDEANKKFVCKFRLAHKFWGPPKHAHGGIVATILDEAMGKVNKIRHVIAVTSEMRVQYLKMVPLGKWCSVESWEERVNGREHHNVAEIKNQKGEVLARSTGKFIAIDPERMFKKFLKKNGASRRS
jgi:acyl-coenzyme A thioesterase PaaI-like protein